MRRDEIRRGTKGLEWPKEEFPSILEVTQSYERSCKLREDHLLLFASPFLETKILGFPWRVKSSIWPSLLLGWLMAENRLRGGHCRN